MTVGGERWLTLAEAAERVARTDRTIRNWVDADLLHPMRGRYRESELIRADKTMRAKVGRPRKAK